MTMAYTGHTHLLQNNDHLINREYGYSLLISSLPGKALRTLVESRGLPSDSTYVLKAEPGKLDIKRHEPGILFIRLQVIIEFHVDSKSLTTSFKKCYMYIMMT